MLIFVFALLLLINTFQSLKCNGIIIWCHCYYQLVVAERDRDALKLELDKQKEVRRGEILQLHSIVLIVTLVLQEYNINIV